MKMHIEIDCTPEEARSFMGLPDVEQANKAYVDSITDAMKGTSNMDQMQDFAKQLAPMGQMGLKMFQSFAENASRMQGSSSTSSSSSSDNSDS